MEHVVAQAAAPTLPPSPELEPQQEETGEGHGVGSWAGHFGEHSGGAGTAAYSTGSIVQEKFSQPERHKKETNAPFQRLILIIFFPLDFIEISPLQIAGS